jgi:signal transduction histidine kinase
MHSSHTLDQLDTCFDDTHAIANAGLLLTATLAGLRLEAPACSPAPTGNRRSPTPWRGRPARGTVEQLLALARGTGAARDRLEMEEVLPRVERGWHGRLAADGRPLRVRVEGDLPPVRASTEAVTQVMDVLVGNAAEHGAGTVTVRPGLPRRAGRGGQRRGPGRGRGNPARVFASRDGGAAGHRIGLALARSLAEAEGGRLLRQHAEPPTVFVLLLPGDRSADPEDTA